jgi:hypothetical protein
MADMAATVDTADTAAMDTTMDYQDMADKQSP